MSWLRGVGWSVGKEVREGSTSHSLCGSGCEWKNVSSREEQLGWFWALLGCWVGSTLFLFFPVSESFSFSNSISCFKFQNN